MRSEDIVEFVRDLYGCDSDIPLHAPVIGKDESAYIGSALDSGFVSSIGQFVDEFELRVASATNSPRAVSTVNGTAALHASLVLAGVAPGDLVITQALTFVATCNALYHMGAFPIFCDVSMETLGLCPSSVESFLGEFCAVDGDACIHRPSGRRVAAIVPMHTFGHPVELDKLLSISVEWCIPLVEDAAESLGSTYRGKSTGTFGMLGALSFNGNKVITTGGGGMVLCSDVRLGERAKHITTTAKTAIKYDFYHDVAGFNYRMPNINAALGCAQMKRLASILSEKRNIAAHYRDFFRGSDLTFIDEPPAATSNFWLNAVICPSSEERDHILEVTNNAGVQTRRVWDLMYNLPMYSRALRTDTPNSTFLRERLINLPSSAREAV